VVVVGVYQKGRVNAGQRRKKKEGTREKRSQTLEQRSKNGGGRQFFFLHQVFDMLVNRGGDMDGPSNQAREESTARGNSFWGLGG